MMVLAGSGSEEHPVPAGPALVFPAPLLPGWHHQPGRAHPQDRRHAVPGGPAHRLPDVAAPPIRSTPALLRFLRPGLPHRAP